MKKRASIYAEYAEMDIDQLHGERRNLSMRSEMLTREATELRQRVHAITDRINDLRNGETGIGISDHALVRYLERVKGIDVRAIREEIRQRAVLADVERTPDQVILDHDGVAFAVYDGNRLSTIWLEPSVVRPNQPSQETAEADHQHDQEHRPKQGVAEQPVPA